MIVVFSTSSPYVSVGIFTPDGELVWTEGFEAHGRASEACLRLLKQSGVELKATTGFVSDIGPGSFTGVRVGVTLAKMFAWQLGVKTSGISSFDLISPDQTVALPSKRNEWFVREPKSNPIKSTAEWHPEWMGYGPGSAEPIFPNAGRVCGLIQDLAWVNPEAFSPEYLTEPSISIPKKLNGLVGGIAPVPIVGPAN